MEIKDLFQAEAYAGFMGRIESIRPDTQPIWGKMNSAQVMAHMAEAFVVALGDKKPPMEMAGKLFGWMIKGVVSSPKPYRRNTPTSKNFIFPPDTDFEKSKARLISLLTRFHQGGPAGVTDSPHPFFGRLTVDQWNSAMSKHMDHHLTQFGV